MVAMLFFLIFPPASLRLSPAPVARQDRSQTLVEALDIDQEDVRKVLKKFFKDHLFGFKIAPDVQGTVTLSLRNVTVDTALQNILRQVDATYRIDHGFYEIVHRSDTPASPAEAWPSKEVRQVLDGRYDEIRSAVKSGKGSLLSSLVDDQFKVRSGSGESKNLANALRALIELERNYPIVRREYAPFGAWELSKSGPRLSVLITYKRGDGDTRRFFDRWEKGRVGWQLMAREDAGMAPPKLVFRDAEIGYVVHRIFAQMSISADVDPSVNVKISGDFTGMSLETALRKILDEHNLTYRVIGGVYHILPRSVSR